MSQKIIQIAVASDSENGQDVYGLDEDGNLYQKVNASIPPNTETPFGKTNRWGWGDPYWEHIYMPFVPPSLTDEQLKKACLSRNDS